MRTLTFRQFTDQNEVKRWTLAAALASCIHAAVLSGAMFWHSQLYIAGTGSLPMMVDLLSLPPTQEQRKQDVAPGPVMEQSPAAQARPEEQSPAEAEKIPPAPLQQSPAVYAPLERREHQTKAKEKVKRTPDKPQRATRSPAPRTTAPSLAAQAARANYTGMLSAHLQRFKQYPPASRSAGEQGVAMLNFTVTRNGQVSSSRLSKSSGFSALDAETIAMIRRAQPLPSFPPEMTQGSLNITVPVRFAIR